MMNYQRDENKLCNIPLDYIENRLPLCPICKKTPNWHIAENSKLLHTFYLFRCESCNSVLSVDKSDVNGMAKLKSTSFGFIKHLNKKDLNVEYVTVEKVGDFQSKKYIEGKEFHMEELQKEIES
ncbi:MAG: hypothetical protein PHH48_08560 [Eubacteriales bacterium]|nr:hypothetical protein [Eubacteriales bacterium]